MPTFRLVSVRFGARAAIVGALATLAACHPLSCWVPPDFPAGAPYEHTSTGAYPDGDVKTYVDDHGIPHIFAQSRADAVYALGFFHAKDRLWQLQTQRYGVHGRLTELLGEDFLDQDRQARLLVYGIEDHYAILTDEDKALCEAYAAGVNDGAAYAGNSIEMTVLGVTFEPFEAIDALAIARFLGWRLSSGWDEELARVRIAARVDADAPLYDELLAPVLSLGNPVVRREEHSGVSTLSALDHRDPAPPPPPYLPRRLKNHPAKGAPPSAKSRLAQMFAERILGAGASNVWGVSGAHTASGVPVLANDPHLGHSFPGLAYLAHVEGPGFQAAGATIPGLPAVLLGHGKDIAWGATVSNADSQDMVRIERAPDDDGAYMLDGAPVPFETFTQRYIIGSGDDAEVFEEDWQVTTFGPLLPPGYHHMIDEGDTFAILSTHMQPLRTTGRLITSLWDLAAADNVERATAALQDLTAPPISFGMAFTDGTIAYRLNGDIPLRQSADPVYWPRDGRRSDAGWTTFLPPEQKPQLTNPARGYFVSANQRMVEADGPAAATVGVEGDMPFRAARITERLEALLKNGRKASPQEIYDIQQDAVSILAREVAPIFGTYCPAHVDGMDDAVVEGWCDALRNFDGEYDVDSVGALVFNRLERDVRRDVLVLHLGEDVAEQVEVQRFVNTGLYTAYLAFDAGEQPALFDDPDTEQYEGLGHFLQQATDKALPALVDQLGPDPAGWRWGNVHRFAPKGPLSVIPVLGLLFTNPAREQAGCARCPRAEQGNRDTADEVNYGAFYRLHAEMSTPVKARGIMETGQSGHFGHRHSYDQNERWSLGLPVPLVVAEDVLEDEADGRVVFHPK